MIISDTHKFIFFAAGRTGTTSLEESLGAYGADYPMSDQERRVFEKHMPPAILKQRLSGKIWGDYWKFAFVRNPWDWMVSRFYYDLRRRPMAPEVEMISEDDILRICFMKGVRRGITWTDYRQQYAFLSNELGHLQVDFVGRFESLQRDFDKITERLSIERTVLPKLNATNHRHYSTK